MGKGNFMDIYWSSIFCVRTVFSQPFQSKAFNISTKNLIMNLRSGDRVQRTASLLMGGVDMDRPGDFQPDLDILAKKEGVLRDIEDKKNQIKEAKGMDFLFFQMVVEMFFLAWIQNGLMTVVGVGVMAYLQTLESMGS